ncbi:hypothetical protein O6H91_08G110900 [Diphasiastrum complanatum]|uniref:Uncharacterized protein n=3 Tax=Diphasiastrum complanatum TaxID=34168 RepID=A0ACC2D121_DIPCM|nr:hypothetical protein O6H91_Y384900 [Diphasiastrum complanatum]KAJ7547947.1 hypothetical protein O6H91_08G110900 [Diphasiastrum complanatum]
MEGGGTSSVRGSAADTAVRERAADISYMEVGDPKEGQENWDLESMQLEQLPLEDVLRQLKSTGAGLSEAEASKRLLIFGANKLEEKKRHPVLEFLSFLWNPLSWVMELAAFIALVAANGQGQPPDWEDAVGIIILLLVNATLSFIEERNAGKAASALMANLALEAKVLRNGQWKVERAEKLVPGDVISLKGGDIISADARLLNGDQMKVDQSALTGESLPVTKTLGDEVYSGSTCKQGESEAVVIATGVHSFFGKAAHLVDTTEISGHLQKVLTAIGSFCICIIFLGIILEVIVMYPIQRRRYRDGVNNILVLLIGGIPIAMPTVLSITMAIGSHHLADQGAIVKRMTAIEEMAGMDILCSDKTGTLTLNKLSVDKDLIEVFSRDMNKDDVLLLSARASRVHNPEPIDKAIIDALPDRSLARDGIQELHFLPFNPVDKRAALTYTTPDNKLHRASKGAPEQILELAQNKDQIKKRVQEAIEKLAERGVRALGVARQEVPDGRLDSLGGPWEMVGIIPLLDPPRHDTAGTIKRALQLGINVKMVTGDQLAIGKETARRLGMGSNMYAASILTGQVELPHGVELKEIVEKADGFAGVFPEHKYNIVKLLQEGKHTVGMTGDGVNDAPALKKADIGIAVAGATDAARDAADIVLTEPGLSTIISAIVRSRIIFQRMKNYTIYAVTITVRMVLGFLLIALIWKFDFPPFMMLIIAFLNDGTIITISKDRVRPSQTPDKWKLSEIFLLGTVLGVYLGVCTVLFFYGIQKDFFSRVFGVRSLKGFVPSQKGFKYAEAASALYLQVSIISQAVIFVTRSQGFSCAERPGMLLIGAFVVAQLVATLIAVYADWRFVPIRGIGWGWAGVIWLYDFITFIPLDIIKLTVLYLFNGRPWDHLIERKVIINIYLPFVLPVLVHFFES